MRATTLLARLWLLGGSFVAANYDSRGPEVEFFYRAYRMDVDLSVAEFLANPDNEGKDPNVEKPWQLGRNIKTQNDDLDWPKGGRPNPFYGLNFHAWMAGVDKGGRYGRIEARRRIDDPVNPDFKAAFGDVKDANGNYVEPRRNIMRVPPDSGAALEPMNQDNSFNKPNSLNKWSYSGLDPAEVFGGLNQAQKGSPLGNYFEFDNILGIVGNRCRDLYAKHPTPAARAHYEAMAAALEQAQLGREMESRHYQIEASIKVLEKYEADNRLSKGTLSRQKDIIKTKETSIEQPNSWYPNWKYNMIDLERTRKTWPKTLEKHKEAVVGKKGSKKNDAERGVLGVFARQWAKGDLSYISESTDKRVTDKGMRDNHNHLQVMRAENRLMRSIRAQVADPNGSIGAPGCNWYATRGPGEGGGGSLPDPLRKRLALAMLQDAMTPA